MDFGFATNQRTSSKKKVIMRRQGLCSRSHLRRAIRALRQETRQYFQETSLHGFKYITSPESTIIERCIWITVCAMGIVFSVVLMCLVWQRFQQTPTVTTIDTTSHPIWELAFPAVSICNFNKIYEPRADRLRKEFKKIGLNDTEIGDFIDSLPKLIRPEYIEVDVTPGMRALAVLGHTVEEVMQLLMQPCDKMLLKCAWLGRTYNCSKMFQTIKSIEGYCCAFNYHAVMTEFQPTEDTNKVLEAAADSFSTSTQSPGWIPGVNQIQKVAGSGRDVGLSVVFDLEGHLYGGATRPYIGASILISDPEDYPEISLLSTVVEPGHEVDIAITGTIIESVSTVRTLPIAQRQCWYDDEAVVGSSKQYSYQTCVTECRIDHIRSLCGCVPFYYPQICKLNFKLYELSYRIAVQDPFRWDISNVRTCELTDVKCMRDYRRVLSSLQTPIDLEAENKTTEEAECNCLPQCSDKWYSLFSENADLNNIKYDSPMLEYYSYGLDIRNLSLMHVYFRDITCLKYRKDILQTWDGLFASFGGIFGLCLGGSVISLVELIYYYMVRIFHKKKQVTAILASNNSTDSQSRPDAYLKKINGTGAEKINNLPIFTDNIHFRPNNYTWKEVGAVSTEIKSFKVATKLKSNRFTN